MCRTIQLFRYLGLTAAPGMTCKIIKHITASLSVSGLEAQDVLAKEQNARDFAMESGLAHDEASPAKICEDPSCRATEAPARVLGSLGSKLNSQVVKWTKWTPFIVQLWSKRPDGRRWPPRRMTPVQRQRCQREAVYVCVWIQWRNMIWRLWRDELASIWSYKKKHNAYSEGCTFHYLGQAVE